MVKMYEEGIPGARLTAYLIGVGLIALGGKMAANHLTSDPPESACLNPLLHGPYEMTIQADANIRTTPHRYESAGDNLAGKPLKETVTFSTADVGRVCISETKGKWYGFEDGNLSEIIGQDLDGNRHHQVWINDQNIALTPVD